MIIQNPMPRQTYSLAQYDTFKDGPILDIAEDGYEVRKTIKKIAHRVRCTPEQLEVADDEYTQAYHRITQNKWYSDDNVIVAKKIYEGIDNLMNIHQKAMSDLKMQLKKLTHPEEKECLDRCITAVQDNIQSTKELKQRMIDCVNVFHK
tara:strand:+ start:636 stop:1082 length:447 start_codon:yes stop_codon:yes gene_type:complete